MKTKSKLILIFFAIFISAFSFNVVFAEEPILISVSSNLDKIHFDGKWTDPYEWKQSSYNRLYFDDGTEIHLRTAHQENFIYVQIDVASDIIINKGVDSALLCFDTKNDKTIIPNADDFCFSTVLDGNNSFTYQGSSIPAINGFFKKIPNDKNFIAVGTASDKFDRYNKIPHASYEFKIPLNVIGRSNNYGFYISVFDAHSQNHYSWPYNIEKQSLTSISSPSEWGDLISPDKSLPEFNFSLLLSLLLPSSIIFLIITKLELLNNGIFKN